MPYSLSQVTSHNDNKHPLGFRGILLLNARELPQYMGIMISWVLPGTSGGRLRYNGLDRFLAWSSRIMTPAPWHLWVCTWANYLSLWQERSHCMTSCHCATCIVLLKSALKRHFPKLSSHQFCRKYEWAWKKKEIGVYIIWWTASVYLLYISQTFFKRVQETQSTQAVSCAKLWLHSDFCSFCTLV